MKTTDPTRPAGRTRSARGDPTPFNNGEPDHNEHGPPASPPTDAHAVSSPNSHCSRSGSEPLSPPPPPDDRPPSDNTLSEILGALGVGFGMFDAEGRLKLHNRLFLSMFGIDPDLVKTGDSFRTILDLFIAQEPTLSGVPDLQAWRDERLTSFYENKGNGVDLKILGRWISTTHHRTQEGETIYLCTDVTEQVETRQRLERLAAELQRSNRDLEQFASIASHDLQEPLRMISSYTALLKRRYGDRLDEQAQTWIGYALDGATRMQRFIADLLEYSRVSTRGRPFVPVDTAEVVRKVLASLRWRIEEKEAVVTLGPLPDVTGDEVQLTQVFQNLVSNALKFGRDGVPVRIHIEGINEGARVRFTVRDNGIGIDPEAAKRIFVMFERLHPRDAYEGSGIGLPICKRIVERHGGSIWVESHEGEGSAFVFTIATGSPYPPPAQNKQDSWEKNR